MNKNKYSIVILLGLMMSMLYANPVMIMDYPEFKTVDNHSDGAVTMQDTGSVYLFKERIEVTIDQYDSAEVVADYTLKSTSKIGKIRLQLPFMETPSILKIQSGNKNIRHKIVSYKHSLNGYVRSFDDQAAKILKRDIPQLTKMEEASIEMQSALFSIDFKRRDTVSFQAKYSRKIGFNDTTPFRKIAEREKRRAADDFDHAQIPKPMRQLYRDLSGYLYNYTYLFRTGLSWPEPIEKAELVVKIKRNLIKKMITEKELINHDKSWRSRSNSGMSLFTFNEDGQRQTCLLTEGKIEGDYRVFYFEKEKWIPTQNAGIVWLGKKPQKKK